MKYTNELTHVAWEEVPYPSPGTWDLSDYIPEGVLLPEHLFLRYRQAQGYWTNWFNVPFDPINRAAIWSAPFPVVGVEIRRQTPRYDLVRNPLAETSRVSEKELQVNADQGMMVALEWAAEYGVDGHSPRVSGLPPISIGGKQHTQNHWTAPTADFGRKVWNFQFSGGYLHKTHVKAQARVSGQWQELPIDYSDPETDGPTAAPFRLIGPFQLYLDLATLGDVDALVIYRRTPREDVVDSPDDAEALTGPNMTPSAKHAFFVAVELGEEMSRNVPPCECLQVFTSEPYPAQGQPDYMSLGAEVVGIRLVPIPYIDDKMDYGLSVASINLRDITQYYREHRPDELGLGLSVVSIGIVDVAKRLDMPEQDRLDYGMSTLSISITQVAVRYENHVADDMTYGASVQSITLT